ncbi:hypothetical protein UPYG_G00260820 [Umbra pygmaea]|uniref:protein-tyrosine-phosphatase n=1 Tax=Umbra pygmaea TaxID=75934 RepID=A0ABD0WE10_UMBPY
MHALAMARNSSEVSLQLSRIMSRLSCFGILLRTSLVLYLFFNSSHALCTPCTNTTVTTTNITVPDTCSVSIFNTMTTDSSVLTSLSPGSTYNLTIQCNSSSVSCCATTTPERIATISVTEVTTSSVSLSWPRAIGSSFYNVEWTGGNFNGSQYTTAASVNVTGLSPGLQYVFTVTALAEDKLTAGQNNTVSQYTKPATVRNLNFVELTTSVYLTWTPPVGNSLFYIVEWTDGSDSLSLNTTLSSANITQLTAGFMYTFTVTAVAGDNTTFGDCSKITTFTKPDVIRTLIVFGITTSSVSLSWTEPLGNSLFYRVEWTNGTVDKNTTTNETHFNITELTAGVEYTLGVITIAGDGITEGTKTETLLFTKPDVIRNLTVTITTSSVYLNWTEPMGKCSFYRVEWSGGSIVNETTTNITYFNVTELTAGVQYTFSIIALAGDNATEGNAYIANQATEPGVISPPSVSQNTTSLLLTWTQPPGVVAGYEVQWDNGGMVNSQFTATNSSNISGLIPGTWYRIQVFAIAQNNVTTGDPQTIYAYTQPGVVSNVSVTGTSTSSVSLSWYPPPGNSSQYKVDWVGSGVIGSQNMTGTNITVSGLNAGVQYNFTVTAVAADNSTGNGNTITCFTYPEKPVNIKATAQGTSYLIVNWTLLNGRVDYYSPNIINSNFNSTLNQTSQTTANFTSLLPGTVYNVSVTAVAGPFSNESAPVQLATEPGVISPPSVSQNTTSLLLTWTQPPGVVAGYKVQWDNGGMVNSQFTATNSSNISGLIPGTQYRIQVFAIAQNNVTTGDPQTIYAYTQPGVVSNLSVTGTSTSSLSLSWYPPLGNSSQYKVDWVGSGVNSSQNMTGTNITVSGLNAGVQYNFTVTAIAGDNSTGNGNTITCFTYPEKPVNIKATAQGTSYLIVNWTLLNGRVDYYSPNIINSNFNSTLNQTSQTTANFTSLLPGTVYNVSVTAVAGPFSNESAPVQLATVPTPPGNLNITGRTTNSISVQWKMPDQMTNASSISYNISYQPIGIGASNSFSTTALSYNQTSLSSGTLYTITVNTVGPQNLGSSPVNTSGYTLPYPVLNLTATPWSTSSVNLTWVLPVDNKPYYTYRVQYSNATGPVQTTVQNNSISVIGLNSGTGYKFTVTSVAAVGSEGTPVSVSTYTKPGVISPPSVSQNTTSLLLTWTQPPGVVAGYKVQWDNGGMVNSQFTATNSSNISGLFPGTQYRIQVFAIAQDKVTTGDPQTVYAYTLPTPPGNLNITGRTTNSISVQWKMPDQMTNASSISYNISYQPIVIGASNSISTTALSYNQTSLSSGTLYTITVNTVGPQNLGSSPVNTSGYTLPYPVLNLTATPWSTSSVNLTWVLPVDNKPYYNYRVQYSNATGPVQTTVQNNSISVIGLNSGTGYNFTITSVAAVGSEGTPVSVSTYTKPGVISPPSVSQNTTSLLMTWTQPPGVVAGYKVQWDNGGMVNSQFTATNSSNISGLIPGTQYRIQVFAIAQNNITTGDPQTVYAYTQPGVVMNLNVTGSSTSSVSLSWYPPPGNSSQYKVDWVGSSVNGSQNMTGTNITVSGLNAGVQYNFTVTAVAGDNSTGNGNTITWFTYPEKPVNIKATAQGTSYLIVNWTLPNGRVDYYSPNIINSNFNSTLNQTSQTTANFTSLLPGTVYNVSVTAVAGPFSNESAPVQLATVPTPPGNLNITGRTTNSISVQWKMPDQMTNASSISYNISYQPIVIGANNSISTTALSYNQTSLSSGTLYTITVNTVGPQNLGSSPVNTSGYTLPYPVLNLTATPWSTSSVNLTWVLPVDNKPYYTFRVQYSNATGHVQTTVQNNSISVIGLNSGTGYNFTVTSVAAVGSEGTPVSVSTYTKPGVISPPSVSQNTTSLLLTWTQPPGVVAGYKVQWDNGGMVNSQFTATNSFNISGLIPGIRYRIQVFAIAQNNVTTGDPQTVYAYTLPYPVLNLTATPWSTSSVNLTWVLPVDNKPYYTFRVQYSNATGPVQTTVQNNSISVTGLNSGTGYNFTVTSVAAVGSEGTPVSVSTYTSPEVVKNIVAIGTNTTMTVSWNVAAGHLDSYEVTIYNNSAMVNQTTVSKNQTVVFSDLTPGIAYTISVGTNSGPITALAQNITNATYPNLPGAITVQNQTNNSINISWTPPMGMNQVPYTFSVFNQGQQNQTNSSWFLWNNLQSGTPYNISVVTVAAFNYQSPPVMMLIYTRPDSPIDLVVAGVTPTNVSLDWVQQDSKADYSYSVNVTSLNGSTALFSTNATNITIPSLQSGSSYTFTVTTLTPDGTESVPVTVQCFTKPYPISGLVANTVSTNSVNLTWTKPLQYQNTYSYLIQTQGCVPSVKNQRSQVESAVILQLTPGTNCTFTVFVQAKDGTKGDSVSILQYTQPQSVNAFIANNGSNSTLVVSWAAPQGNVEQYIVYLNNSETNFNSTWLNSSMFSYTFQNLAAGSVYTATVFSVSGNLNNTSGFVTTATYPNPPGNITILEKNTSFISVNWSEAPLMANTSFSYLVKVYNRTQLFNLMVNSSTTSQTLANLLSGTTYSISVTTVGSLGFQSKEVWIYNITTRPDTVQALVLVPAEENVTLQWKLPNDYKPSYTFKVTWANGNLSTNNSSAIISALNPGSRYTFNVITQTADGTQGAPVSTSDCTTASPVLTMNYTVNNSPNPAQLNLSWANPQGMNTGFQIIVNNSSAQVQNFTYSDKCTSNCTCSISGLSYYTDYTVTITTLSCGLPSVTKNYTYKTGIGPPPNPPTGLVTTTASSYNSLLIQLDLRILNNANGPVTQYGVLITSGNGVSNAQQYLGKTYINWKEKSTETYMATVRNYSSISRRRKRAANIDIMIGDGSNSLNYYNGQLVPNSHYSYAIVLFTQCETTDGLVNAMKSIFTITDFNPFSTPQNPEVIGLAAGLAAGIVVILCLIVIIFIMYSRRHSKNKESDIQIQPISAKVNSAIRMEEYEAYYTKQKADSNCGFATEFEDLKPVGTAQAKNSAIAPENKPKNRYNNVLPYDSSRVKLSIQGSPFDDYINCNYIPGYNSKKEFIAAQGPLPFTVNDFWRMIWEKNVQTLVMLTRCNEQGRVKCEKYWPSETKCYDNINVITTSDIPLEDWTIRDFEIKNVKTAETRLVRQFHFTAWPDHGVPQTTELLINFRHLVREHMNQYSRHSPTVVHCSAGVGRTGTLIAIDRLIFQIERESIVDVYGIIHDLRMHRPLMVQTEDQYVFLNQCAMDIIRARTGTNVDLIYQNTTAFSIYENVDLTSCKNKNGYHSK